MHQRLSITQNKFQKLSADFVPCNIHILRHSKLSCVSTINGFARNGPEFQEFDGMAFIGSQRARIISADGNQQTQRNKQHFPAGFFWWQKAIRMMLYFIICLDPLPLYFIFTFFFFFFFRLFGSLFFLARILDMLFFIFLSINRRRKSLQTNWLFTFLLLPFFFCLIFGVLLGNLWQFDAFKRTRLLAITSLLRRISMTYKQAN